MTSDAAEAYLRRRTGIAPARTGLSWKKRLLRSKWTWLTVGVLGISAVSIITLIRDLMKSQTTEDGVIPGLNSDALWLCFGKAMPTLVFWIACFVLIDRYKPQRLIAWFLAVMWGGCVAITGAYYANSWVAAQMAVVDETSGTSAVRAAVFVAPFVEEFMKACVIFLIASVDRNRFTSRVSGAVIGGLAGAGFAFTENIIYYARVVVYGSYTSGAGDVMEYLDYMVLLRGVLTCFGHPLFTLMTGVGVAFAVTSRSKTVRVLAPVTGYLFAALLHMFFNWASSMISEEQLVPLILIIAWPIVILVLFRVIVSSVSQGRTVKARLGDYVTMGWLPDTYPAAFSRLRTRAWTVIISPWHANVIKTWTLQTRVTQLALLREAITRGTVDDAGIWRERELVDEISRLAHNGGLVNGKGLRPYWPWKSIKARISLLMSRSRNSSVAPHNVVGSPITYSDQNPRWGPPE